MSNIKNNILQNYINAFIPPVIWALVIFFLSDQEVLPGFSINALDFISKKLAHMFVYAVLYLLIYRGVLIVREKTSGYKTWLFPLLICFIYAITDEIHQSIVPGRHATIRDISYDMLGASIVILSKIGYI